MTAPHLVQVGVSKSVTDNNVGRRSAVETRTLKGTVTSFSRFGRAAIAVVDDQRIYFKQEILGDDYSQIRELQGFRITADGVLEDHNGTPTLVVQHVEVHRPEILVTTTNAKRSKKVASLAELLYSKHGFRVAYYPKATKTDQQMGWAIKTDQQMWWAIRNKVPLIVEVESAGGFVVADTETSDLHNCASTAKLVTTVTTLLQVRGYDRDRSNPTNGFCSECDANTMPVGRLTDLERGWRYRKAT